MKTRANSGGFTLIEALMAVGVGVLVGLFCYNMLHMGAVLYAKNISLNVSNLSLRYALDRMNSEISEATATPELISVATSGTGSGNITANASSPAAGIRFDKYLGERYVIVNASGSGLSNATSFQIQRSTDPLASPPIPSVNDVLLLNGTSTRAVVTSCSVVSTASNVQTLSVTVSPGVTFSWLSPSVESAMLVHEEAFVVQGTQLLFYPTVEGLTTLKSATNITLTSNVSSLGSTPFTTSTNATYVSTALVISSQQYSNYLANKQGGGAYNTYATVSTLLRPRNSLEISSP